MNVGISVTRVGSAAQTSALKQVSARMKLDLASYRELAAFAQFAGELDRTSQAQLTRGQRLVELLKQPQQAMMSMEDQTISVFAGTRGYLDDLPVPRVSEFERGLLRYVRDRYPEIPHAIASTGELSEETQAQLEKAIQQFKEQFGK